MSRDDDYEIGYRKPPKKSRFKKGQSGNPKGRPKGVRNLQSEVDAVFGSRMTMMQNGRKKSVSVVQAALLRLVEKALKGDGRSIHLVVALARENSLETDAGNAERRLNREEDAILADFGTLFGEKAPRDPSDE